MKQEKKQFLPILLGEDYAARRLSFGALLTLLLLAVLIALNTMLGALPKHLTAPDVSGSETFRLSGAAKDWLATLDESVTVYLVSAGGEATADVELYAFLQQIARASDHVKVSVLDSNKNAAGLAALGVTEIADQSVIVTSAKRHRVIRNGELYYYYYPYSNGGGTTLSSEEYLYMLEYWSQNDPTGSYVTQLTEGVVAYFDGASRVINAISYVLAEQTTKAYVVASSSGVYPDAALYRRLSSWGYEVVTLASVKALPSDCGLLILYPPTSDLSEEDATALSAYLAGGGKMLLLSYLTETLPTRLDGVLAAYGMQYGEVHAVVCDPNPNSMTVQGSPYLFRAQIQSGHAATSDFAESFVVYSAHAIKVSEVEGVTTTPWLYTTQAGYPDDMNDETPLPEKGEYAVGVTAEKGETRIVWLSCAQSLGEEIDGTYAEGGNTLLLRHGMTWLTGTELSPIEIAPTVIKTESLKVGYTGFLIWSVILVLLIPGGVIAGGAVFCYIRKKR